MANDPYRDSHQFDPEPPAKPRSWLTGCILGCLVFAVIALLLTGLAAIWISRNWKAWTASTVSQGIKQTIATLDLPPQEKIEVMAEVDRAAKAFADGQMSGEQAAKLLTNIVKSPLMTVMLAAAADKKYIAPSGLNAEEKVAANVTLQRFARGVFDDKISEATYESVMKNIATKHSDRWELRDKVSDDELRKFLAEAEQAADDADIEENPPQIDPSDEIKRLIDQALSNSDSNVAPPLEIPPVDMPPPADSETPAPEATPETSPTS